MHSPRLFPKAVSLLILLPLVPWGTETARADDAPDLSRIIAQLFDVNKQQGEINDQLKTIGNALAKEILSDKPTDKKAKEARAALKDELTKKEEQLASGFREATLQLLVLKQRLAKSDIAADREKAALLQAALKISEDTSLPDQFAKLTSALKKVSFEQLEAINQVRTDEAGLRQDLQKLVDVLSSEDRGTLLQRGLQESKKHLNEVQQLAKEQKALHDRTAGDAAKSDELVKIQAKLTAATRSLSKEAYPVWGKSLSDAVAYQEKSEQAFKDGKSADAVDHQKKALEALEAARKRGADVVAQFEEEIAERAKKKPR